MHGILCIYPSIFQRIADRRLAEYCRLPALGMGVSMNQRDRELLDKQFQWRRLSLQNDGEMIFTLVVAAVITLGGALLTHALT
jgi:hypothetical protein